MTNTYITIEFFEKIITYNVIELFMLCFLPKLVHLQRDEMVSLRFSCKESLTNSLSFLFLSQCSGFILILYLYVGRYRHSVVLKKGPI